MMGQICMSSRSKVTPWLAFVIMPAIVYKKPRFGIFAPEYEALAFFLAVFLGYLIGSVIDEISWRHHVQMHKVKQDHNRELSRANRRSKALEDLACGQESYFFDIIR